MLRKPEKSEDTPNDGKNQSEYEHENQLKIIIAKFAKL